MVPAVSISPVITPEKIREPMALAGKTLPGRMGGERIAPMD